LTKIAIIGGGSYSWGPTFLRDIFTTPELKGSTLVLHDILQDRMDLIYALARKVLTDFQLDFHLEKTLSLDEALQGADFIILTITTGRLESMRPDLEIPAQYGIHQAVGDTTGPGGLARALRNIPVIVAIAQKVNEICPDALFLNYTNPMSTLTRALCMSRTVPRRTVGLCHEYLGVRRNLAKLFETSSEKLQARVAGINHLIWITDLYVEDRHVWDELPSLTAKILDGIIKVDADDPSVFADHARVKSTLFQMYGALPAAGDRHIAEFFPHFINESTNWGADYGLRLTSIADRCALEANAKQQIEAALRGELPLEQFMQEESTEAANKIIRAVVSGDKYFGIMNLPNTGQIGNLPAHAIVETFGLIDQTGVSASVHGEVPAGVQNVLEHHVRQQEMTVEAALTGSWDLALQVLLNDPLSSRLTIPQARQMLRELLEANKVYLLKFFGNPS
jgi:alpha-galactosidase